jgi:hypothetical protein
MGHAYRLGRRGDTTIIAFDSHRPVFDSDERRTGNT